MMHDTAVAGYITAPLMLFCSLHRGIGSPSTWDLHRFELIAQEVLSYLPTSSNGAGTAADQAGLPSRQPSERSLSSGAPADSDAAAAAHSPADAASRAPDLEDVHAPQQQQNSSGSDGRSTADLGAGFPFTLVAALNAVLYQRQGYKRMARHGTPQ